MKKAEWIQHAVKGRPEHVLGSDVIEFLDPYGKTYVRSADHALWGDEVAAWRMYQTARELELDAQLQDLNNKFQELVMASSSYREVTKSYFSDTSYDADGQLAEADANLFCLLYNIKNAKGNTP